MILRQGIEPAPGWLFYDLVAGATIIYLHLLVGDLYHSRLAFLLSCFVLLSVLLNLGKLSCYAFFAHDAVVLGEILARRRRMTILRSFSQLYNRSALLESDYELVHIRELLCLLPAVEAGE